MHPLVWLICCVTYWLLRRRLCSCRLHLLQSFVDQPNHQFPPNVPRLLKTPQHLAETSHRCGESVSDWWLLLWWCCLPLFLVSEQNAVSALWFFKSFTKKKKFKFPNSWRYDKRGAGLPPQLWLRGNDKSVCWISVLGLIKVCVGVSVTHVSFCPPYWLTVRVPQRPCSVSHTHTAVEQLQPLCVCVCLSAGNISTAQCVSTPHWECVFSLNHHHTYTNP